MKRCTPMWMAIVLTLVSSHSFAGDPLPEPGPVARGIRLQLVVSANPPRNRQGYDVKIALINISREPILIGANQWRSTGHKTGFRDFLQAAVSIESYPAIEPWLGQVMAPRAEAGAEPERTLKPGETLTVGWYTSGRQLKNVVSNPLEVQNPEFAEDGLYSVHASLFLTIGGSVVRLRSNEQLVSMGGSLEMPKHTYGPLWSADQTMKTAMLGLGSLDKIAPGDRFLIQSGVIGMTWTLTITQVDNNSCTGTLEPSKENPPPTFPSRGMYAALIRTK